MKQDKTNLQLAMLKADKNWLDKFYKYPTKKMIRDLTDAINEYKKEDYKLTAHHFSKGNKLESIFLDGEVPFIEKLTENGKLLFYYLNRMPVIHEKDDVKVWKRKLILSKECFLDNLDKSLTRLNCFPSAAVINFRSYDSPNRIPFLEESENGFTVKGFSEELFKEGYKIENIIFDNNSIINAADKIEAAKTGTVEDLINILAVDKQKQILTNSPLGQCYHSTGTVIFAAGQGSRFVKSIESTDDINGFESKISKVLQPIVGESILRRNLEFVKSYHSIHDPILIAGPKSELGIEMRENLNIERYKDFPYFILDNCHKLEFLERITDKEVVFLYQILNSMQLGTFNSFVFEKLDKLSADQREKIEKKIIHVNKPSEKPKEIVKYSYRWGLSKNPFWYIEDILILNGDSMYPSAKILESTLNYFGGKMNHKDDAGAIVMLKPTPPPKKKGYELVTDKFVRLDKFDSDFAFLKTINLGETEVEVEYEPAFYMIKNRYLRTLKNFKMGTTEFFKQAAEAGKRVHVLRFDAPYFNINDINAYENARKHYFGSSHLLEFLKGENNA